MGRRRQRHFNPATAGCHAVVDARFGMVLTGYPYVSEVAARVGTIYNLQDLLLSISPQPYNINGQACVKLYESSMALRDINANPAPFYSGDTLFICAKLDSTTFGYQRMVSCNIDIIFAAGCNYTTVGSTGPKIFTIAGNGSTWNDIDTNTPSFDPTNAFAMSVKRDSGTKLTPVVNTVKQDQKNDGPNAADLTWVGRGPSPAVTQYWNGDIAMIAAGQTTGVPMDRRILQMMGRVWRIHTL